MILREKGTYSSISTILSNIVCGFMNLNKFGFEVSLNEAPLFFIWYPNKIFRVTGTWLLNTLHRVTQMSVLYQKRRNWNSDCDSIHCLRLRKSDLHVNSGQRKRLFSSRARQPTASQEVVTPKGIVWQFASA